MKLFNICPFIYSGRKSKAESQCLQAECALYTENNCCAVVDIDDSLKIIDAQLLDLAEEKSNEV